MSDEYSSEDGAEALQANECPVCHGLLVEKDGAPWCPSCDLKFTP
jgi:uncharacterized Zn finger protein (UPF0148 family)